MEIKQKTTKGMKKFGWRREENTNGNARPHVKFTCNNFRCSTVCQRTNFLQKTSLKMLSIRCNAYSDPEDQRQDESDHRITDK